MSSSRDWRRIAIMAVAGLTFAVMITAGFAVASSGMAWASGMWQMPGTGGMAALGTMHGGGMTGMGEMHKRMHGGQAMPAECTEMMNGNGMMGGMMDMMHDPGGMDPANCQAQMAEQGVPAEMQAICLQNMAEAKTDAGTVPQPQ